MEVIVKNASDASFIVKLIKKKLEAVDGPSDEPATKKKATQQKLSTKKV